MNVEYRRLFPNGVPLRGPLTVAQQAWLTPSRRRFPEITRPHLVDDPSARIVATDRPDVVIVEFVS